MKQGKPFEVQMRGVVNVSKVPQRSPFRYPGGKTWLIPIIRQWLNDQVAPVSHLIEPFAGGGIVSLTAAFESLADRVTMVERDEEVAAVWNVITNGRNRSIADRIVSFDMTHENANAEFLNPNKVTNKIIEQLEKGAAPWRKAWDSKSNFDLLVNGTTNKRYQGINIPLLWISGEEQGFECNEWGSFNQWRDKKEMVAKGQKGTAVIFYDTIEKQKDGEIEKNSVHKEQLRLQPLPATKLQTR